jgi:hypothetical protein
LMNRNLKHTSNHVVENSTVSEIGELDFSVKSDKHLDGLASVSSDCCCAARAQLFRHFDIENFFTSETGLVGVFTGHVLKRNDAHSDQIRPESFCI